MLDTSIEFSGPLCLGLLAEGRYEDLTATLIEVLDQISGCPFTEVDEHQLVFLDTVMTTVMACMISPSYVISRMDQAIGLIRHNETLSSIAAMSSFKTTDSALRIVLGQRNNLVKIMVLASPRNRLSLDIGALFDANGDLASLWYFAFIGWDFGRLADGDALAQLRRHFAGLDGRLGPAVYDLHHPYFLVTYAAPEAEPAVKRHINTLVRAYHGEAWRANGPRPEPDPGHVAVLSGFWQPSHAVYRTHAKFVESLKGRYRLTLVCLDGLDQGVDASLFDQVVVCRSIADFEPLKALDPMVAFYPDVGMTMGSIVLANFRLAPIQIMGCGHPVSTFGSEIDYYVSGADLETGETAAAHYSERLVLIPGRGVVANPLPYPRTFPDKPVQPVRVGLSWAAQKVNHDMLRALRRVADSCLTPVEFHFFSATGLRSLGRPGFVAALREALGADRVVLHPYLEPPAYFEAFGHMHVAADSHPFGGFNTVVDPLFKGVPVIGFEGSRVFARFGPHLLRTLGFDELVATDTDEYVRLLVRMIDDAAWRSHWTQRIQALDLDATVFAETNGACFLKAVDHLIANHEHLRLDQDRRPIIIN